MVGHPVRNAGSDLHPRFASTRVESSDSSFPGADSIAAGAFSGTWLVMVTVSSPWEAKERLDPRANRFLTNASGPNRHSLWTAGGKH